MDRPPILVLYHGNCPDGFGAALAAYCTFGDIAEYRAVNYGEPLPPMDLFRKRHVYLLDFTYPKAELILIKAHASKLHIIDHHKTAAEDLRGFPGTTFNMEYSGAVLTWDHFNDDAKAEVPILLQYIEDRDLWRFKLPDSHAVSLALWSLPRTFDAWKEHLHDVTRLRADGKMMLAHQQGLVRQMCEQSFHVILDGNKVPVVCASVCFSEVAHELLQQHPDAPFAAYFFDRGDGQRQWGLRSRGDFDVSAVARKYGGGGHAASAGFSTASPPVLLHGPVGRTVRVVGPVADCFSAHAVTLAGEEIPCTQMDIRVSVEGLTVASLKRLDGVSELVEVVL